MQIIVYEGHAGKFRVRVVGDDGEILEGRFNRRNADGTTDPGSELDQKTFDTQREAIVHAAARAQAHGVPIEEIQVRETQAEVAARDAAAQG